MKPYHFRDAVTNWLSGHSLPNTGEALFLEEFLASQHKAKMMKLDELRALADPEGFRPFTIHTKRVPAEIS